MRNKNTANRKAKKRNDKVRKENQKKIKKGSSEENFIAKKNMGNKPGKKQNIWKTNKPGKNKTYGKPTWINSQSFLHT